MDVAWSNDILAALAEKGLIHRAVHRVVLDIEQDEFVVAWVQLTPDTETLRVVFDHPAVQIAVGEAQADAK